MCRESVVGFRGYVERRGGEDVLHFGEQRAMWEGTERVVKEERKVDKMVSREGLERVILVIVGMDLMFSSMTGCG